MSALGVEGKPTGLVTASSGPFNSGPSMPSSFFHRSSHAASAQLHGRILLAGVISLSLAVPALSQDGGAVLARIGDTVPGGASVTAFGHLHVNDSGSWAAIVSTDDLATLKRVFRDGSQLYGVGDPSGSGVIDDIIDLDLSNDGVTHSIVELSGGGQALFRSGAPLLETGDLVSLPEFGPNAAYFRFQKVNANADGDLVVRCLVADPTATPPLTPCLMGFEAGSGGTALTPLVLARAGDVLPGQTLSVQTFGLGDNQVSFTDDAYGTFCARLDPAATPGRHVVYNDALVPIYQGGRNSPVLGRTYLDVELSATDINASRSWVISALLDSSSTSNDEVIIRDGAVYAREGGNLLAFPGAPVIDSLGFQHLFITDPGDPVFYVNTATDPSSDEAIVRGDEIVLREGMTLASGETVTDVNDLVFGFTCSDSGEYTLAQAIVDGGNVALIYLQAEFGEPYCAAENNSTGTPSVTTAGGTALVSLNALELTTTGLPPGSFAYYLSSLTPGNVLFPGGSSGRICLAGSVGRHIDGVGAVAGDGTFRYSPDLTLMPTSPNVAVFAGDTWHHQLWHRDSGPTSNFSLPVRVTYH